MDFFNSLVSKPEMEIIIDEIQGRKKSTFKRKNDEKIKMPTFHDRETISGKVIVNLNKLMEKTINKGDEYGLTRSLNGWTWGSMGIDEKSIKMTCNEKDWFTIFGSQIMNITTQNKTELGLEFHHDDDIKDE